MANLMELFNLCDYCVYAPCVCGNEPENCADYVQPMGQHKHNPVVMMAKNGELPPKPKKMGKREFERLMYAKLREIICNQFRDGFSYNGIKLPPLPDAEEWGC